MKFQVKIDRQATKDLEKIPKSYQEKILAVLPSLAENPYIGKKLEGKLKNAYSYRIGLYRIIYKVYKDYLLVIVIRIGHRQGVY
ncbi:type II toxin-antitoxin system RelE/ParE family toxin [Patescibacteria group bacterium]|nr:type II toxin-antitoxin system RelE/ParE family toxin [Patescibacteria group bacterium]